MTAIFSPCRTYRYELRRKIRDGDGFPLVGMGLNPSDAAEEKNDPTITRLMVRADMWGCNEFIMVNALDVVMTKPKGLPKHPAPSGPDADYYLARALSMPGAIILVCWGANKFVRKRAAEIVAIFGQHVRLQCLGKNKDGSPIHPLYVPYDQPLEPWP